MVRLALDHSCPANPLSFARQSGERSHAARGRVAKTPYFPKTISCLVVILGSHTIQGVILVEIVVERWRQFRTNFGRVRLVLPDSSSGQVSGDFKIGKPPVNHSCDAGCSRE